MAPFEMADFTTTFPKRCGATITVKVGLARGWTLSRWWATKTVTVRCDSEAGHYGMHVGYLPYSYRLRAGQETERNATIAWE